MPMRNTAVLLVLLVVLAAQGPAAETAPPRTFMVPMRDGVRLATDVYLPSSDAKSLPCILMRTPYGRKRYRDEVGSMARWGYAVAIGDMRGRFDSEGKAMGFASDGWGRLQDGYDTVAWLARRPFSNGRVGTVGASAMGIVQNLMAPTAPPGLKCQYILVAPADHYHEAAYVGGVLRKRQVEGYLAGHAHPDALRLVLEHPRYDDHWKAYDATRVAGRIRAPAIHYGGWYDTFCEGTLHAFLSRQTRGGKGARGRQKLVMGPWTHGGQHQKQFGDFELPEPARSVPVDISPKRWFDHYLKGKENGAAELPAVTYYVMGPLDGSASPGNVWRTADSWPVAAEPVSYYLQPGGRLARPAPPIASTSTFVCNPADLVPTCGGRNLYLPAGPKDQRRIERRDDVLVFTTRPLTKDVEVTGRVTAEIFLATKGKDADVALRLCDVYPDRRSILVAEGIGRLSSVARRHGGPDGDLSRPTEVVVDLWSTSIVFAKGHAVRLSVSGSNYPHWETNPDAGSPVSGETGPARSRNTVYLGGDTASRVVLPIVSHPR